MLAKEKCWIILTFCKHMHRIWPILEKYYQINYFFFKFFLFLSLIYVFFYTYFPGPRCFEGLQNLLTDYPCIIPVKLLLNTLGGFQGGTLRQGGCLIPLLFTMTPWTITNKRWGECSYHTSLRALFSTMKLPFYPDTQVRSIHRHIDMRRLSRPLPPPLLPVLSCTIDRSPSFILWCPLDTII
jgi:hypothetical protein